jgi:ferredoxin
MPHTISSECVSCGSCESQCPVNAISRGKNQYTIDTEKCIDCGACVDVCPVSAISPA